MPADPGTAEWLRGRVQRWADRLHPIPLVKLSDALAALEAREQALGAVGDALALAAQPYVHDAAPHEELFSAEDLRNFERLTAALAAWRELRPEGADG